MLECDAELVARVRRGDIEAFGVLSRRYERTVLSMALRELQDLHAAEDVVQTTFLMAFRGLRLLRDEAKFSGWLLQIARTRVIDEIRARKRNPVRVAISDHVLDQESEAKGRLKIRQERLLDLIHSLPEHEARLIQLRYFDGHSTAEIAAIVARPLGTVSRQLYQAIARLRTRYKNEIVK